MAAPQRFYETASAEPAQGGFQILLDGKRVRTPRGAYLVVPTRALADAIVAEWAAQGAQIDWQTMPLTGLAHAAIDHVRAAHARFVEQLAGYAQHDLVCYRAVRPEKLIAAQAEAWDPLVEWAAERYGAKLTAIAGVIPQPQPGEAMTALRNAIAAFDPFALTALTAVVTLTGSVVIGLAVAERRLDPAAAWAAARVDELHQIAEWGEDAEAEARAARMGAELAGAVRFMDLLRAT